MKRPVNAHSTPDSAIEQLLAEIAQTAFYTDNRVSLTPIDCNPELQELELDQLRKTIAHMGWIADLALHRLGSVLGVHNGDATAWLLAPVTAESLRNSV